MIQMKKRENEKDMGNIMKETKDKMLQGSPILKYLYYSGVVTVLDALIGWLLYRVVHTNLVFANSVGIIAGFILHYILSSKSIFDAEFGMGGFVIYFGTFLLGLGAANALIYVGNDIMFQGLQADISFLLSKGISVVIPFFLMYYIRKVLFDLYKRKKVEQEY